MLYQLNCAGNITASSLNNAFTKGADVVFILACGSSMSCKYYDGEAKIDRTKSALELMLQDLGLQPERLILARPQENEEDPLGRVLNEALAKAKELEPNPFYQGS
jgi:F420-non-reducing hydrogenase iron-sulfur subunit